MKQLILLPLILLLLTITSSAQIVIPTDLYDFIQIKGMEKRKVSIERENNLFVYYRDLGPGNEKLRKVPKKKLETYHRAEYSTVNFRKNVKGKISYSEVVEVETDSIDLLFYTGRLWLGEYFKLSEYFIDVEDISNGLLVATGYMKLGVNKFWMTIKIQVKPRRFKYTITNLVIQYPPGDYDEGAKFSAELFLSDEEIKKTNKKHTKIAVLKQLRHMINDLKISITTAVAENSNW